MGRKRGGGGGVIRKIIGPMQKVINGAGSKANEVSRRKRQNIARAAGGARSRKV